jgi:DNA polymerase
MNPELLKTLGVDWPWLSLLAESTPPAPVQRVEDRPKRAQDMPSRGVKLSEDSERIGKIAALDWAGLQTSVAACQACGLHQGRQHPTFGVGPVITPTFMLIGEAPGVEEDATGEPFVGAGGQLLDRMIEALEMKRAEVFITNTVKCRPPGNRSPQPEESECCSRYLERQIELLKPKVIVALGRVAAGTLLKSEFNLNSLRGRVHQVQNTPLVVTYHPNYLLRNPIEKARAWQDLCLARDALP